jgi:uncharacterized protein with PQ loop repeat
MSDGDNLLESIKMYKFPEIADKQNMKKIFAPIFFFFNISCLLLYLYSIFDSLSLNYENASAIHRKVNIIHYTIRQTMMY